MFGLTTTRRLHAELAAAKAETDRQRQRAENAIRDKQTAETNRAQVLRQIAEQDAAIRRLRDRNLELGRRVSQLAESDPDHCAALEQNIARVEAELAEARKQVTDGVVAEWRTRAAVAEKRVKHLEKQLDDAVGLPVGRVEDSRPWQPAYQKPADDVIEETTP
ncbi:hypothetical protein [Streptomyces sp. NPDC005799]|uniref:hypothetical protein n=1 Tax=Streptomyces sp. NPDC005799 TaxID=3154678 RepID=UPI0033F6FF08